MLNRFAFTATGTSYTMSRNHTLHYSVVVSAAREPGLSQPVRPPLARRTGPKSIGKGLALRGRVDEVGEVTEEA